MNSAYEEFGNHIIRPFRAIYEQNELGQNSLTIGNNQVMRQDIQIVNRFNEILQCSFFSLVNQSNAPCIVYSHCNSGNRLEGMMYLTKFIENGFQLCCFDFRGCGISDGNYVSLGFYESWDIEAVVNFLRKNGRVGKIILWGRSMGSVASLIYASRDPYISAIVLDSPFKSLNKMILELASKHYQFLPKFILQYVIKQMEKYVQKTAHFKFNDLEGIKYAKKCQMFGIFITSKEDEIVNHKQVNELYQQYAGSKQIVYTNGGHNNYRNDEMQQKIISILKMNVTKDYSYRDKFKGFYLNSLGNQSYEKHLRAYSPQSFYNNYNTISSFNSYNSNFQIPMTTTNAYFISNQINQLKKSQQMQYPIMTKTINF